MSVRFERGIGAFPSGEARKEAFHHLPGFELQLAQGLDLLVVDGHGQHTKNDKQAQPKCAPGATFVKVAVI